MSPKFVKTSREVAVVLFAVAIVCALVASISLSVAYRQEFKHFKGSLYAYCVSREPKSATLHASLGADVTLYHTVYLLDVESLPTTIAVAKHLQPAEARRSIRTARARIAVFRDAYLAKKAAYDNYIVQNCSEYRP